MDPQNLTSQMDYYQLLGITKTATQSEIKKAYYKKAQIFHPDKNKESDAEEKFKEVSEAYDVLSDEQKRKMYDLYGKNGPPQTFDPFDMMGNMFHNNKPTRVQSIDIQVDVTLLEFFSGTTKIVKYKKYQKCAGCDGKGSKKPLEACKTCKGQGKVTSQQRVGPMVLNSVNLCPDCNGEGKYIKPKDLCKGCQGRRYLERDTELKVEIEAGMSNSERLSYFGAGHEQEGLITGDVIVSLNQLTDDTFERRGNDLYIHKSIDLIKALTGTNICVNTINGNVINIKSKDVIEPESYKKIPLLGMPIKNTGDFGDLYILFHVSLKMTDCQRQRCVAIFGATTNTVTNQVTVENVDQLPDYSSPEQKEEQPEFTSQGCTQQ